MTVDEAAIVALKALEHVAAEQEILHRFLLETGSEPTALARQADRPEFLAGVLEFLLNDESRLLAFCEASGLNPEIPGAACRALSTAATCHE